MNHIAQEIVETTRSARTKAGVRRFAKKCLQKRNRREHKAESRRILSEKH